VTTFLKQYGERRTGTNALRALVAANCPDAVVLMHILGDKHSPPVSLDEAWRDARDADDPPWAFVSRATLAAPAATTVESDPRQAGEMRRHAAALAQAYAGGRFGYLVSVRDPYAWAAGVARFLRWPPEASEWLRAECVRFNDRYRAWLALADSPWPTVVVRHEDLVRDSADVLAGVAAAFRLPCRAPFVPLNGVAGPVHWDHSPLNLRPESFDGGSRLSGKYHAALPASHRDVVTETVDWALLAPFGYAPRG
jgi:hypothetical protein